MESAVFTEIVMFTIRITVNQILLKEMQVKMFRIYFFHINIFSIEKYVPSL